MGVGSSFVRRNVWVIRRSCRVTLSSLIRGEYSLFLKRSTDRSMSEVKNKTLINVRDLECMQKHKNQELLSLFKWRKKDWQDILR